MTTTILPKGSIVKINGFPCELVADTEVYGEVFAREGLGFTDQRWSLSHVDAFESKPYHAASPDSLATSNSSPESK